jgi:hypothetical protein
LNGYLDPYYNDEHDYPLMTPLSPNREDVCEEMVESMGGNTAQWRYTIGEHYICKYDLLSF